MTEQDLEKIDLGWARTTLQYFGFNTRDIEYVKAIYLNEGERVQLALAKLMLQRPNVLILDEPTDGLSDEIKNRLLQSLRQYRGTLILVSHNRDFYGQVGIQKELQLPSGNIAYK